ncbi:MAG: ATP-binding cassette domain-containing protein, partial [Flavobacteriales bacterium]
LEMLLNGNPPNGFHDLKGSKGALFSKLALEAFIEEEERHGTKILTDNKAQSLKTYSSGEQKKALLRHILRSEPDFIVLDNPFDNLDIESQTALKKQLAKIGEDTTLIQIISRSSDLLPFINRFARLEERELVYFGHNKPLEKKQPKTFEGKIPLALNTPEFLGEVLIELKNVNVAYMGKPILKQINWLIKRADFWELRGKNGSGKTTLLSMITGENPKGYGQDLFIFGKRKGSGESVWDIKKNIGYFTPSMTDTFTGYHSVENMVISGLTDSIGLYVQPTEAQLRLAKEWLQLINMWHLRTALYHDLSMGQKRLLMCIRAMIKHPVLLILDEPTAGLDDDSASLFVALVNKFSRESDSAIIFVSHRKEPGLQPQLVYELEMSHEGSLGKRI